MTAPKANAFQISTVLQRAAPLADSPEKRLILAILGKAVADAMTCATESRPHMRQAEFFFREGNYRPYCELIDLNPDWVGEVLRDYAGIECADDWGRAP